MSGEHGENGAGYASSTGDAWGIKTVPAQPDQRDQRIADLEWANAQIGRAAILDAAQLRETLYAVQTEAEKDRERLDWIESSLATVQWVGDDLDRCRVRCMESEGESSELRRAIDAARGTWGPRT